MNKREHPLSPDLQKILRDMSETRSSYVQTEMLAPSLRLANQQHSDSDPGKLTERELLVLDLIDTGRNLDLYHFYARSLLGEDTSSIRAWTAKRLGRPETQESRFQISDLEILRLWMTFSSPT